MNLLEAANARGITGFMHPVELELLSKLATDRDVLEIGSYRGLSAWCMAKTARSLTCVDTFKAWTNGQTQDEAFTTLEAFSEAIRGLENVTCIVGTSEQASSQAYGPYDLIFLDAMHTYEDVRDDIERWWPKLRRGGIMAFHDYGHDDFPGVKQAVDERFGSLEHRQVITLTWTQKP